MSGAGASKEKIGRTGRHERILDAAEVCFVRNGIHRTTMQDIAGEAAMSAGNIYRYYPAKEAVILDLAEREAERAAPLIAELERTGGRRAVVLGIMERYFAAIGRESAILRVDLWAEATRSADVAALISRQEAEARAWFVENLAALATSPTCDAEALWSTLNALLKGIIVARAVLPDFDPMPDFERAMSLMDDSLRGNAR